MHNEFTGVFEQDEDWFIGYCPEVPGANGQGRSLEECRENLREAIKLILEDRRQDALRGGVEAVPRHTEIRDQLAKKICRGLSIPVIGR